jgi:hypothetical protein
MRSSEEEMDKEQVPLEAMDGDKAQFLRKAMDKGQFPWCSIFQHIVSDMHDGVFLFLYYA